MAIRTSIRQTLHACRLPALSGSEASSRHQRPQSGHFPASPSKCPLQRQSWPLDQQLRPCKGSAGGKTLLQSGPQSFTLLQALKCRHAQRHLLTNSKPWRALLRQHLVGLIRYVCFILYIDAPPEIYAWTAASKALMAPPTSCKSTTPEASLGACLCKQKGVSDQV